MKQVFDQAMVTFAQPSGYESGGIHTPPEMRLLLASLVRLMRAEDILELGYDYGYTTEALACGGGNVIGVDDFSEYPDQKEAMTGRLIAYPNITLVKEDALAYLQAQADESFDLIFVDDFHEGEHVYLESLEVRRILRMGGVVVYHDPFVYTVGVGIEKALADWPRLLLPALSQHSSNPNYGILISQKPRKEKGNGQE